MLKSIDSYLIKKLKSIKNNLILIGCSDAVIDEANNCNNIKVCYALNNISKISGKYEEKGRIRRINLKKFKRKFKKNKNTLIVNFDDIVDHYKRFIPISVYITKDIIYLYCNHEDEKLSNIVNKYKRYKVEYEEIKLSDGVLYRIDCKNKKINFISSKMYIFKDTLENVFDLIGDYLIN